MSNNPEKKGVSAIDFFCIGFGAIVDALCGFPSVEYAAHTIVHHLNDYGGQRYEMGYASAIAVILFVVMVGANLIIKKGLSKIGQ